LSCSTSRSMCYSSLYTPALVVGSFDIEPIIKGPCGEVYICVLAFLASLSCTCNSSSGHWLKGMNITQLSGNCEFNSVNGSPVSDYGQ
jgi:hypothetical protein